jgi:tRNA U55 pseudouridine synthase TruB
MLAAAAKLTIVDGTGEFTRDQLHAEMKTATGLYKKTYSNNFGNYLGILTKNQQLHEVSKDKFSLPQGVRADLEKKLAP